MFMAGDHYEKITDCAPYVFSDKIGGVSVARDAVSEARAHILFQFVIH